MYNPLYWVTTTNTLLITGIKKFNHLTRKMWYRAITLEDGGQWTIASLQATSFKCNKCLT